jgi:hypothetical protein
MPTTNPIRYTVDEPSQALLEAAFLASMYHGGQGCPLYALQCGEWRHLTAFDYEAAAAEFQRLACNAYYADTDDQPHLLEACSTCLAVAATLLYPSLPNETAHYRAY